jgi:hypothetical protein
MDYKELFELINKLPDGALKDLSEVIRKNQKENPNITLEQAKAQIERFHGKRKYIDEV